MVRTFRGTWGVAVFVLAGAVSTARAEPAAELCATADATSCAACSDDCGCLAPAASPWEVSLGFVHLNRSTPPSRKLAEQMAGPVRATIDANQFEFDSEGGPDLTIVRHGDDCDLEFRWFQVHDWSAQTAPMNDPVGYTFPFRYMLTIFGNNGVDIFARQTSQLNSFEWNLKRPVNNWISVFGGFRFVELNEQLVFNCVVRGIDTPRLLFVRSFNDLYGFQTGADVTLWDRGGPFRLSATGKAGIYGNDARNRSDNNGATQGFVDSASTCHGAFLGEIGLIGAYQLTRNLSVKAGYEVMWIDGVALAPQQEKLLDPVHDPFDSLGPSVSTHNTAFYHGVVAGLEYRF